MPQVQGHNVVWPGSHWQQALQQRPAGHRISRDMGYCLKLHEPLSKGLQRIFREEIEAAVRLCRNPSTQRGVTVHEVRKHLKKLRAALRLTKNEVGKNRWAREDRCLRGPGGAVSGLGAPPVGFTRR